MGFVEEARERCDAAAAFPRILLLLGNTRCSVQYASVFLCAPPVLETERPRLRALWLQFFQLSRTVGSRDQRQGR